MPPMKVNRRSFLLGTTALAISVAVPFIAKAQVPKYAYYVDMAVPGSDMSCFVVSKLDAYSLSHKWVMSHWIEIPIENN